MIQPRDRSEVDGLSQLFHRDVHGIGGCGNSQRHVALYDGPVG
jgi:hypothetical protein